MASETVGERAGGRWALRRAATATADGVATVRRELGVAFFITTIWPVTVFAAALMVWAAVAQFSAVERERRQVATRVAGTIDGMVDVSVRSMQAAAAVDDPAGMTPAAVDALVERLLRTQSGITGLSFVDADGRLRGLASTARPVDADTSVFSAALDAAASAVESGEVAFGGGLHEGLGEYAYAVAVPTRPPDADRISGALVIEAPMSALADLLGRINAEARGSSYLVTADGTLIADENIDRMLAGTKVPTASSGLARGIGGVPIIAGTAPLAVGGGVVTVVSAENALTAMAPAALAIIPSALLLCLVAVARRVRDRLTHRIVEPIEALAGSTRRLAGGDLTARAAASDIDEFDRLATDFNSMADRLQWTISALEHRTRRLVDSNRQLEDFASVAAHDLREPLRKIQFFGDRLEKVVGDELHETARDHVVRMSGAARRMSDLIDSLLAYARVSTKAAPFDAVDLNQTVAGVLSDLERAIEELDAQITVDELPVVHADPMQMRQLFQNLISNALKYHEPGTPVRVAVTADADDAPTDAAANVCGRTRVLVRDNGIGIDSEQHDQIFGVFTRLHGRSEYDGAGIGLAVCRRIIDRHDGCISVESRPGEGSTFVVNLPRHASPEDM